MHVDLAHTPQGLGRVNFIFTPVTSLQAFLTGLAGCLTDANGPASSTTLDATSKARYTTCSTNLKVTETTKIRNWVAYRTGYACILNANRLAATG
ncbi:unnamed protein product [Darwinula stevensoni]|uniref:Uncharacterized protein n=1 Tax=Darwinula stevensoni TaxID=69355 RepID=A0A7R9AGU5_9CRUS|nr:unnamed protein product [Darwinula stevensoni]CAG0903782.1 unnamed protein product [Darwinula stevensoni]